MGGGCSGWVEVSVVMVGRWKGVVDVMVEV